MTHKLENPIRVAELNPVGTLQRIGLQNGDAFCDIGAGTGVFVFAAAELTQADVYAVEISDGMLQILQSKQEEREADNVHLKSNVQDVPSNSCAVVLLCTVLHELEDVPGMMMEVKRILRPGGVLAVIEFHKRRTPLGPPEPHRISREQAAALLRQCGLREKDYFDLGENFYTLLALDESVGSTVHGV